MPKTNIRGGNKKKRGKNGINELHRNLDYAVDGQYYAQVFKILGSGRFMVKCYETDKKTKEFVLSEKICHVRGKMRKKVWVNDNDLVLISIREFDTKKGDIIHKYTYNEAKQLIKQNLIPSIELVNGKVEENNDINFEYSSQKKDAENTIDTINTIDTESDKDNESSMEELLQKKNEPYSNFNITDSEDDIDEI